MDAMKLNVVSVSDTMQNRAVLRSRCENDILKLVNCIMENTKGEDSKGGEDFWSKAEALYYQALIAYIWYEAPENETSSRQVTCVFSAPPFSSALSQRVLNICV